MKMIRSLAKHLHHPLLCRLYDHVRLREEPTRAVKVVGLANVPPLEALDLSSLEGSEALLMLISAWSTDGFHGVFAQSVVYLLTRVFPAAMAWSVEPATPVLHRLRLTHAWYTWAVVGDEH